MGEDVPMRGGDPLQGDRCWLVEFVLGFLMSSSSMIINGGRGRWVLDVGLLGVVGDVDVKIGLHGMHIFLFLWWKGESGGFGGGRASLDPDLGSQLGELPPLTRPRNLMYAAFFVS